MKIKTISKQSFDGYAKSQLVLELSDTTSTVVNTLRRAVMLYVPTYAFPNEGIEIDKEGSTKRIFDNDYMSLRLSQITLQNLDGVPDYLPEKYWKGVDYSDPDREKHEDDTALFDMYISVLNKTNDVLNVTTDSKFVKVFRDGEEIKKPFGDIAPMLLIQLRKDEQFQCRMKAMLGVGFRNDIWSSVARAFFDETKPGTYKFTIESQGQFDETTALVKSCKIIKEKLKNTVQLIKATVSDKQIVVLRLKDEDHTLGNILNEFFQANKNISCSGISKPDQLVDEVIIEVEGAKGSPINDILKSIDDASKLFDDIEKQLISH